MKKKSLLLSLMLIVGLTACGESENSTSDNNANETTNVEEITEASSEMAESETEEAKPADDQKSEAKYEITNTYFEIVTNSIGTKHYGGIVEITNTGDVPIYLNDCKIDFEDTDGHLIKSEDMVNAIPDVVQPGEKGYFVPMSDSIDDSVADTEGLQFKPNPTIEVATGDYHILDVSDVSVRMESMGSVQYPVITGRINNNTNEEINMPIIAVVFYDDNNAPFAVDRTYGDTIKPDEESTFEISCSTSMTLRNRTEDELSNYIVFAGESSYFQF